MPAVALLAASLVASQPAQASTQQATAICSLGVPARISVSGTDDYYPNRTRRYRVHVPGTTSIWDDYSPVISR